MKTKILFTVALLMVLFIPSINFAQAPNLGTASGYALFTSVGAFTNTGASIVTGDIGTNAGALTGFPPGTINGQTHIADPASVAAATDLATAYGYLSAMPCGIVIGVGLGNNQILTPNVYCTGAASTLNGNLTLDAQGDPNALFVIKIDGALSTGSASNIVLINSASLCNVYWQINGQFDLGASSVFRGVILCNGAINLYPSSSLYGKALSVSGAISLQNNVVTTTSAPVVANISGITNVCVGQNTGLSNSTTSGVWSSSNTLLATVNSIGVVTGVSSGAPAIYYTVTNSGGCITRSSTSLTVNKNTTLATITGASNICKGFTTNLSGTPAGGTWLSNNASVASVTNTGVVTGVSAGVVQFIFTNTTTTCSDTTLSITINAPTTSTATTNACGSYLWNGVTYTSTGTYTKTLTGGNSKGCDSVATLHLTVNVATGSSTTISNCGSYLWNGVTYPATGTFTKTFTGGSSTGCDSIATLHLSINHATYSTTTVVTCGCLSYTWNGINYTSNGIYIDTLIGANSVGCDSITTINLTLNLLPKTPVMLNSTVIISGARNGVIYSVIPVAGAVSYQWAYSGSGATIHSNGTASITVDFAANATGGDILVQSVSTTGCLSIAQTVIVTINVLPVVLSNFSGLKFNKDVVLKWTSVSEINVAEFNIQRSNDGYDFNKVGTLFAKGSGNYTFDDNSFISTNIIYYQLEIVGTDGSKDYSKILAINMDNNVVDISIYPNPAKGTVMIISPYSNGRLAISNLMGETILSQQIIDKQTKVNIERLLPGVYIINILNNDRKITSKLIVL